MKRLAIEAARRVVLVILMTLLCAYLFVLRFSLGVLVLFFEQVGDLIDAWLDVVVGEEKKP